MAISGRLHSLKRAPVSIRDVFGQFTGPEVGLVFQRVPLRVDSFIFVGNCATLGVKFEVYKDFASCFGCWACSHLRLA